jgi:hypothetical protein
MIRDYREYGINFKVAQMIGRYSAVWLLLESL